MVLHYWRLHSPYHCPVHTPPSAVGGDGVESGKRRCNTPQVGDEVLGSPIASHLLSLNRRRGTPAKDSDAADGDVAAVVAADGPVAGDGVAGVAAPPGSLLGLAQSRGYSALGEMFNATMLAAVAAAVGGYKAAVYLDATFSDVRRLLEAGRPVLVPFDVDTNGEPKLDGEGESAHYAVIVGLVQTDTHAEEEEETGVLDEEEKQTQGVYVLARHSWNMRDVHAWQWRRFCESWRGLLGTSFYGNPDGLEGSGGTIPSSIYTQGVSGLKRPARVKLKKVASDRSTAASSIFESLSGALVEVVPSSLDLFGTTQVNDNNNAPLRDEVRGLACVLYNGASLFRCGMKVRKRQQHTAPYQADWQHNSKLEAGHRRFPEGTKVRSPWLSRPGSTRPSTKRTAPPPPACPRALWASVHTAHAPISRNS
jgi:hypothetical protein